MSVSTCIICGKALSTTGDHQVCSLACGHLVGFKCINEWFEQFPFCPVCNKEMKLSDIQLLFWTTSVTSDSFDLENMVINTKKIKNEIQSLEKDIHEVEEKLKKGKDALAKNVTIVKTKAITEFCQISQPGLIYDRPIIDGFRMHTTHHIFINTSRDRKSDKFGIQVSKFNSLDDYSFIPLHSTQIRDIASNGLDVITCSLDKTIRITSTASQKSISQFNLSVPLWCCAAINDNMIAAGGDRGFFTVIDKRTNKSVATKNIPGPPVNSMALLNPSTVMCLTAKELYFFDILKSEFIGYKKDDCGGFSLRQCTGSPFYSILTRKDGEASISYKALDQNKTFSTFSTAKIGMFKNIIRPSLYCYGDSIYSAVPNEPTLDFSLFALSQSNYDMWSQWSPRWTRSKEREPVIDCLICEERNEFIVISLSPNHIYMYSVPPL